MKRQSASQQVITGEGTKASPEVADHNCYVKLHCLKGKLQKELEEKEITQKDVELNKQVKEMLKHCKEMKKNYGEYKQEIQEGRHKLQNVLVERKIHSE